MEKALNMDTNGTCIEEQVWRQRSVSESSSGPQYTEKQRRTALRVLKSQNYYDILNVKPDATTDEIISAYKKLALCLHPDKNKAPEAKKAFQVLGNVKDVLSDSMKRNLYDMQQRAKQQQLNVSTEAKFGIGTILITFGLVVFGIGAAVFLWNTQKKEESKEDGGRSKNQNTSCQKS